MLGACATAAGGEPSAVFRESFDDGRLHDRGWSDDKRVADRSDVVLRFTGLPNMKFNQFLPGPYFGPGLLPHAQKLWIDELVVATGRVGRLNTGEETTDGEDIHGNWPQFRGPNRDGISADRGLLRRWPAEGPPLLWKATGLGSGFSSVSVVGGRVYTQGHVGGNEILFVLDEETGRKRWSLTLGPAERVAYPGSRSTPTLCGEHVYVETVAGDVLCIDWRKRAVVWRRHLKRDFGGRPGTWGYAESPLVDGNHVVVTPGGTEAALVALEKNNGKLVWRASIPVGDHGGWKHSRDPYADPNVAAYSSVIVAEVDGVRQYIQFLQQGVVGIRAEDGAFLWRDGHSSNEYANCPTPVVQGNWVFSASGWRGAALVQLHSSDRKTSARLVYANRSLRNWYGGFFFHDGHVYGCSKEILMCMDFFTGEVKWKHRSVGMGSVVYADGHFVMRGDKGTVALVEATPDGYREKGRFNQPARSDRPARSPPVVTGGRLYLRDEGVLLCYDVRQPAR